MAKKGQKFRMFKREEKLKAVKMVLEDGNELKYLGYKKNTGTLNRWIVEYIQEGEENLDLLEKSNYKLDGVILHSERGVMYKSGIYKTKTAELNLIPSMSAPYTCTHNPWIETLNGQFKDFIKNNYPKNLDELQIALKQFVYYNNNIKIKNKLKTTPINYRCSHNISDCLRVFIKLLPKATVPLNPHAEAGDRQGIDPRSHRPLSNRQHRRYF